MSHRSLTRRGFLKASGTGLAGAALLGAVGTDSFSQASASGGSRSSGSETLTLWNFSNGRNTVLQAILNSSQWKSRHPHVTVNVSTFTNITEKLQAALHAGQGAPDIAEIEINSWPTYAGQNVPFVPLNSHIGDQIHDLYTPSATAPWSWNGRIYGIGDQLNVVVLAYRKDIMGKLGIKTPFQTWDEVIAAGQQVVKKTGSKLFGIYDLDPTDYRIILQNEGSDVFDKKGNFVGDSEKGIAALQFNHDLVYKYKVAEVAPATASNATSAPDYIAGFKSGRYVAIFGPPWLLSYLKLDVPEQAGKWTMQKLPKSLMGGGVPTANIGGTGMCITNQSKNVDLAWDLIRIQNMTTEGILHGYKLRTTYPTYKPAYQSPLLKQPSTYFGGVKVGELYASLAPDVQAFVPPLIWPQASQALISNAITPVMQNKTDARAALTALAAQIKTMHSS